MAAPRFVHLRLHSEYSVSDGIVRLDAAVECAARDGMPALALTDSANVFGMVKFYRAARTAGVKPIIGADCWVQGEAENDKAARILLLCASRAGYLRLSDLLSRAWLKNQRQGRAEIARTWLQESDNEGLIALSGAGAGDVGQALAAGNAAAAQPGDEEFFDATMHDEALRRIADETGGRFYTADAVAGLAEDVRYAGRGVTMTEERDLWQMPIVLLALLGLVCAEWGYRRAVGLA
jgi:DNA polymerase III alpha subunit